MSADIGLIGLAVMGENLVLNMESHGYTVAVFNRTVSVVDNFVNGRGKGKKFIGCKSVEEMVKTLKKPRKVMMMVRAGSVVDNVIKGVVDLLEPGDIIIDGGNSHFDDSDRRLKELSEKQIRFVGSGISGGEEGALKGPSIMPGGDESSWEHVKPIFQAICAKVEDGAACCEWVGGGGSGHFVKMVHNGIEYGDMQLICEAYQLLKDHVGLTNEELRDVFNEYNKGDLDSYLIEITSEIFTKKDDQNPDQYVLDLILDRAGQKGTGKWAAISALDYGMPVTLIGEAVFARCLSSLKSERVEASKILPGPNVKFSGDKKELISAIGDAMYAAKLVSYAQGFTLMREASTNRNWALHFGDIALMWRGGCIIRSKFLGKIKEAFDNNAELPNLLLDPFFQKKIAAAQAGWRKVVSVSAESGIPVPAISSALAYYDGYRTERLPANLLQAQRDYFGAHTYQRVDKDEKETFHTNWTGRGGSTSSSTYNV